MVKSRKAVGLRAKAYRSALTNGTSIIGRDIDHRSTSVRRLRDLIAAHSSDLNPDSEAEKSLIRRASVLELELELLERKFILNDGEATELQLQTYQRLTNTLRRTLQSLGLKRRARDVTPKTLDEYIATREAAE
jgi:hypothetical protein